MSKNNIKKFKKNDYSYDDDDEEEYFYDNPKNRVNKRELKRFERALKTKDISVLIEEDEDSYVQTYHRIKR